MCSSCWSFVFSALGVIVPLGYFFYQNVLFTAELRLSYKTKFLLKFRKKSWEIVDPIPKVWKREGSEHPDYATLRYQSKWSSDAYIEIKAMHPTCGGINYVYVTPKGNVCLTDCKSTKEYWKHECTKWDVIHVESSLGRFKNDSLIVDRETGVVIPYGLETLAADKQKRPLWGKLKKIYKKYKLSEDKQSFIKEFKEKGLGEFCDEAFRGLSLPEFLKMFPLSCLTWDSIRPLSKQSLKEIKKRNTLISRVLTPPDKLKLCKQKCKLILGAVQKRCSLGESEYRDYREEPCRSNLRELLISAGHDIPEDETRNPSIEDKFQFKSNLTLRTADDTSEVEHTDIRYYKIKDLRKRGHNIFRLDEEDSESK
jgi:hypothetical protein